MKQVVIYEDRITHQYSSITAKKSLKTISETHFKNQIKVGT